MDNISFWLDYCQAPKAYTLLEKHGYKHDSIQHGDIGGIKAKISGKFFERCERGNFMIAQAIWEDTPSISNLVEEPILFDIITWHPESHHRWYFLRGEHGLILSERSVFESSIFGDPLTLHSTPFAWLKSGCQGSVLLDQHGLNRLYGLNEVICENTDHGKRLERGLSMYYMKNMPRLSVIKENRV